MFIKYCFLVKRFTLYQIPKIMQEGGCAQAYATGSR